MQFYVIAVVFDLLADLLFNGQLASSHLTDSMEQFVCTRSLKHIASSTSIQDWHNFFIVQVRAHNQNLGFRPFFEDSQGRINPIHLRHDDIHDNDIWT